MGLRLASARRTAALCGTVTGSSALVASLLAGPAPVAAQEPEPASRPMPPKMRVFYGTTHVHTGAYNDHGRDDSGPADVFAAAPGAGMSFLVLTEHAGPSGPTDPAAYQALATAAAEDATVDGEFVGLSGFEYSENGGDDDDDKGHLTVFGTWGMLNAKAPGMDFTEMYGRLTRAARTRTVFAGFNHPGRGGHPASRRNRLSPEVRRIVALSEVSNQVGYRPGPESAYYDAFVRHLDRGWRVAPTCALDSHQVKQLVVPESTDKKPCRTGLVAPSLSRDEVLKAILARRLFSTRDTNLRARYIANKRWMGRIIGTPEQVRFRIRVRDPDVLDHDDRITRIQVVGRHGKVVASRAFDAHRVVWRPTVKAGKNPYLFVRVFTGERVQHTAVLAPVWLE
ncbi:hypothetical protein [Nocardioides sp. YIM 152588]|uniref:hypothetical protein n=1 Tax=Nocardioides sp. YIM 152588 TaxID=3158259 RepID=UPI0032E431E7